MSVVLATNPPASAVLATLIDTQRQTILAVLAEGRKRPKARRIHALRVAIRRLLAALQLAAAIGHDVPPGTPRRLRKLMAVLSPLRDLQVQLRALAPQVTLRAPAGDLVATLRAQKRAGARRAGRRLARFAGADFDHDLSRVTGSLSAAPSAPEDDAAVATVLLGELGKRHLRIERQRRSAPDRDPEALHRLRLGLKDYRYALEALAPLSPSNNGDLLATVSRLQDQLGGAHDAHVLAEAVRSYQATLGSDAPAELGIWVAELEQASQLAHEEAMRVVRATSLSFPPQ